MLAGVYPIFSLLSAMKFQCLSFDWVFRGWKSYPVFYEDYES